MPSLQANLTTDHGPDATTPHEARASGVSRSSGAATDHGDAPPLAGAGSELRHDRFCIGEKLGEGGMGVVYRALDTRDGRQVALKRMKASLAGTARRRFEREFRSISALHHPHCLHVYDFGELDDGPFFTMELFQGRPITCVAGGGVDDVLRPLLQVTQALDYIHHQGIIHRDVKPSNILVRPATRPDGRPGFEAKLMDFGLAKYYGVKSSLSAEGGFVGTVAYCAPEQINNDELDHRADLYCLGLLSYELLCGRYPFPEARLAGMRPLMRAQLNDKPRPLAEVNPDVPAPIADAVMRYLRKEARRRPESAAVLRDAIAHHLGIDDQTAVYGADPAPARPVLSVTGFVCRSLEVEALDDVLRRCLSAPGIAGTASGEAPPALVMISGEPGIGKSSVVQEAERIARGHGCQVYEGRCFDGNLAPFQPFVEIIRQLIAELRLQERREAAPPDVDLTATLAAGLPVESAARLLAVVNDYSGELLRIAPELRKYLPGEAYQQVDFGREADYIFRALSAFFVELATLQPICLSLEDLQWADKSSLDLLRHLAAALDVARRSGSDGSTAAPRLTIVASARTGYPQLEALLAPLRERRQVMGLVLTPLNEAEARELIALRLNCRPEDLSDDLVARVHELCGGNPFFVSETVREWFEKDAIARGDSGWVLATEAADSTDLPETVREAMRLRLQGLPALAQEVLGAAAVIGAVIDIDLLREVLPDLTESDVLDAIDALLPRRVFRETGNAGRVQFVHDLLRELSYVDLSATRRRSLHRRVGERLEHRRARGCVVAHSLLAAHFLHAGEGDKVFTYALEAGDEAIRAYAFEDALVFLGQARSVLADNTPAEQRYRLWSLLGSANCSARETEPAIANYRLAAGVATDRASYASALGGIGEAHQRAGQFQQAKASFEQALRESGCWPSGRLGDLCQSLMYLITPTGILRKNRDPDLRRRRDLAFAASQQLALNTMSRSALDYVLLALRLLGIARSTGDAAQLAAANSRLVMALASFGFGTIGLRFGPRAERCIEECQSPVDKAHARFLLGTGYLWAGRPGRAGEVLEEAQAQLARYSHWCSGYACVSMDRVFAILGDTPNQLAVAAKQVTLGERTVNPMARSWGESGIANALARSGQIGEAIVRGERATQLASQTGWGYTYIRALHNYGFVLLQASRYADARMACEESLSVLSGCALKNDLTLGVYATLAESLLGPDWSGSPGSLGRDNLKRAWRVARQAVRAGRRFPNLLPHALRIRGRAAWALGKARTSARSLEESVDRAEALGARYDLARACLDASLVIPAKADEYRHRGQQLLDQLGAVVPEAERLP